jgi:hypothetical protein
MVPLAVDLLLRPDAPPLPPDVPTYTLSLAWGPDGVARGEGTVRVPNPGPAPLADVPFLLHGNDGLEATTRVTRVEGVGRAVTVDQDVRELVVHASPPVPPGGALEVHLAWEVTLRAQPPGTDDLLTQGLMQLGAGAGDAYGLQARGDGITVLASGYPMVAPRGAGGAAPRVVRPDQPIGDQAWNGPARWDVTVTPPPGVRVVTNLADEALPDGRVHARGSGPWDLVVVGYDAPSVVLTQIGRASCRERVS